MQNTFRYDLEPEPVEDLNARDDGEAGEEAHHAAHPGDLVRDGHPGILSDLIDRNRDCESNLLVQCTFVMMLWSGK